jgi:hypothetical protein
VANLKVLRDIYYIADKANDRIVKRGETQVVHEYSVADEALPDESFYSSPDRWKSSPERPSFFDRRREVTFDVGPDSFFALGDNSPASKDSRLWREPDAGIPSVVARDLMVGKALFIYWPRSLDYFPLCPNIPRMGFIH